MSYKVNEQGEIYRGRAATNGSSPNKKDYTLIWVILLIVIIIGGVFLKNASDRQAEVERTKIEKMLDEQAKEKEAAEAERIAQEKIEQAAEIMSEARTLFDNQNYNAALYKLQEVVNLDVSYLNNRTFRMHRGYCYYNDNDYAEAIKDFTESINISSDEFGYNLRAMSYFKLGKYSEAILDYTMAINLSEGVEKAKYYYSRGYCYSSQNNLTKAKKDYGIAVSLDPSNLLYKSKLDKLIKKTTNTSSSIPKYLYKTKTISFGNIPPLKKLPYGTAEDIRSNYNNEIVYVIQETTRFFYKVYIAGKVGYISSSYLVPNENSSFKSISKSKSSTKKITKPFSVQVTSKSAWIYTTPKRRAKYKTIYKRSRYTILETSSVKYNKFYKIKYYNEYKKGYVNGYILSSKVSIYK